MDMSEKTVSRNYKYNGRIINLRNDEIILPNGKTAYREVVEHPGGVGIAALTEENELLMVRQFRYPYSKEILEIPAGKLERGEDPLACGIRELSEETGAVAKEMVSLGRIYPTPGYCEEIIHLYFTRVSCFERQHTDEDEFVKVQRVPIERVVELVMSNEISDAKTQIAVLKINYMLQNNLI